MTILPQTFGGKQVSDNSPFVVTYWHIPGGYNFDNAYVCGAFFDEQDAAQAFANALRPEQLAHIERKHK